MPKTEAASEVTKVQHEGWWETLDADGQRHSVNGQPSVEFIKGENHQRPLRMWHDHGALHRDNGAAIECPDGSDQFWLKGKCLSQVEEIEFREKLKTAKPVANDNPIPSPEADDAPRKPRRKKQNKHAKADPAP